MNMWKKASILPILILILYGLSVWNMISTENKLVNLYNEHTLLLEEIQDKNPSEQKELLSQFTENVKLSGTEQTLLNLSHGTQKIIDRLTPGKEHCLTSKSEDCLVYNGNIIVAAQNRHNTLLELGGQKPIVMSVLNGSPYKATNYIVKAIVLAIEAAVLSILILTFYLTLSVGKERKEPEEKTEKKETKEAKKKK